MNMNNKTTVEKPQENINDILLCILAICTMGPVGIIIFAIFHSMDLQDRKNKKKSTNKV